MANSLRTMSFVALVTYITGCGGRPPQQDAIPSPPSVVTPDVSEQPPHHQEVRIYGGPHNRYEFARMGIWDAINTNSEVSDTYVKRLRREREAAENTLPLLAECYSILEAILNEHKKGEYTPKARGYDDPSSDTAFIVFCPEDDRLQAEVLARLLNKRRSSLQVYTVNNGDTSILERLKDGENAYDYPYGIIYIQDGRVKGHVPVSGSKEHSILEVLENPSLYFGRKPKNPDNPAKKGWDENTPGQVRENQIPPRDSRYNTRRR